MPILTDYYYSYTENFKTNQYIETGTYRGDGVNEVKDLYNVVHSIELIEHWYNYNLDQFKNDPKVKLYHGDSAQLLPEILSQIHEPVTIFLDAHGPNECPLLEELDFLLTRPYNDIIIIDDVKYCGTKGVCGVSPDDPIWPLIEYDWTDITMEAIINRKKDGYVPLFNTEKLWSGDKMDQIILSPTILNKK
jgi:hypothetical protein